MNQKVCRVHEFVDDGTSIHAFMRSEEMYRASLVRKHPSVLLINACDWLAAVGKLEARPTTPTPPHLNRKSPPPPPPPCSRLSASVPLSTPGPPPQQCLRHEPSPPLRARAQPPPLPSSPAPPSDPRTPPPPPPSPPPQEPVPAASAHLLQTSARRGPCASTRRRTASSTMPETTSS